MSKKSSAISLALLAAVFYAVNTPFSKLLLGKIPATFMAAFLYLGAGIGIGILYLVHGRKDTNIQKLGKRDLPYTAGMIVLDILAPILLMFGIKLGTASNASLLGNFEIVATALIALLVFKEAVSKKLWIAISLITASSILLSFEGADSLKFSTGSLLVLFAAMCWGLENNCTRKISNKSTYEIVMLKGFFSGGGSFVIALLAGEKIPQIKYILLAMLLGFIAYGLSIFSYIRAQRELGAAKTSAYYAIAPFIGAFLSFIFLNEKLTAMYLVALLFMAAGTVFAVVDTLQKNHSHLHSHTIIHTHDGQTHEHIISHSHEHHHYFGEENHYHHHSQREIEHALEPFHKMGIGGIQSESGKDRRFLKDAAERKDTFSQAVEYADEEKKKQVRKIYVEYAGGLLGAVLFWLIFRTLGWLSDREIIGILFCAAFFSFVDGYIKNSPDVKQTRMVRIVYLVLSGGFYVASVFNFLDGIIPLGMFFLIFGTVFFIEARKSRGQK